MLSMMLKVPVKIATDNNVSKRGSRKQLIVQQTGTINVYLLLEDQPAKNTPIGAIPEIAIA